MEPVVPGVLATQPQPLSFAPTAHMRAFLLQRAEGDLLVYSSDALADEALDEVSGQYLGHRHEAEVAGEGLVAPVFVHAGDREGVAGDASAFTDRHRLGDDLEVIPIPGHTPGSAAYLFDSGEHRVLFTADSVYLSDGEWVAAVLGSSDREAYIASLELLRELDFDVLAPWIASAGQPAVAMTDGADARRRIGAILERVRRGERR